jgi:23S rRNA pseudouridine1911/1915/1917 synthase
LEEYSGKVEGDIPEGLRLDRYAAGYLRILSRSQIKARNLAARVNGKKAKLSHPVKGGDFLELSWDDPEPADLIPEDIPLDIIYEDDKVVVINKAQGMVVHPGAGNRRGTLANALLARRRSRGLAGAGFRPGIVHRLDKDTSGVIIAAYDDETLAFLSDQFKARQVRKLYAALVTGVPREREGILETLIVRDRGDRRRFAVSFDRGKPARTRYRVIHAWDGYSLLALRPVTGRTHQLRVHLKYLGCPILGDPLYGAARAGGKGGRLFPQATLMLHAKSLSIVIPSAAARATFTTRLPERFRELIAALMD